MTVLKAVALLALVLLVEHGLRTPRTLDYRVFKAMEENPDCASEWPYFPKDLRG